MKKLLYLFTIMLVVACSSNDDPITVAPTNNNGITVALDIQLNEELIEEGIARELINRIQNLRKDAGFEVTDKIILYLTPHKALNDALKNNLQYIKTETLTEEIYIQDELENGVLVEFDNVKTSILIKQH